MLSRYSLAFLFFSLSSLSALAQSGETAASERSFWSPALRSAHFDVAKFLITSDAELNADVDLLQFEKHFYGGVRAGAMETGTDSRCANCDEYPQYYHLDLLGYGSYINSGKRPFRISLFAGVSSVNTPKPLLESGWRMKTGMEFQIEVIPLMTVGFDMYLLPGYQEGMTGFLPLKLNIGYARW